MISAQIDELRNASEFYDGFQAANLMRDAADTIWQLRDDLQRANAENAKLRELTKRMARALGVGSNLCDRNCGWEFECDLVSCPIEEAMRELGIEV